MDIGHDRKKVFRARILGKLVPATLAPLPYRLVEIEEELRSVLPAANEVKVPKITVVEGGQRYYNEKFVRGKIENWAGRPAGGQHHALVVSEIDAMRIEKLAESRIPTDCSDADVTTRALAALPKLVTYSLIQYHMTQRTLAQIAKECGVCIGTGHNYLVQGHADFTTHWEDERHRLNAQLSLLAPATDQAETRANARL